MPFGTDARPTIGKGVGATYLRSGPWSPAIRCRPATRAGLGPTVRSALAVALTLNGENFEQYLDPSSRLAHLGSNLDNTAKYGAPGEGARS